MLNPLFYSKSLIPIVICTYFHFYTLINYFEFMLLWQVTEVRPKVTLVVRMAAAVANYDYIMDWEFQTDGLIRSKVGDEKFSLFSLNNILV